MGPEERQRARQNFEKFRNLPPDERKRLMDAYNEWRQLPEARRDELQQAYRATGACRRISAAR